MTLYYSSSTQICLECPEFSTSCAKNAATMVVEVQTCETNYKVSATKGECVSSFQSSCQAGYYSRFLENLQITACVPCSAGCKYCKLNTAGVEECLECDNS